MTGNPDSAPRRPRYVLDESISRRVAQALEVVDVPIVTARDQLDQFGAADDDILDWCGANDAVWIHADRAAYTKHRKRMEDSGARTLWVVRPGGQMSRAELLRIISFALPLLEDRIQREPGNLHYRLTAATPLSIPRLERVGV